MDNLKKALQYLPVRCIRDKSPRQTADAEELQDLTDSVALYGVLQPLSVRAEEGHFVLLDGAKRLRAAKRAGMDAVPCLVTDEAAEELWQKLKRQDLHYIARAELLRQFMARRQLQQAEAAALLGMSQGAVANSLRLLRHPPQVLQALKESGLSQRHARALLNAPEDRRLMLIAQAAAEGWSVSRLEKQLAGQAAKPSHLEQLLLRLGSACRRQETDTEIILTVRLPKPAT